MDTTIDPSPLRPTFSHVSIVVKLFRTRIAPMTILVAFVSGVCAARDHFSDRQYCSNL